jgi:hypothetical protein
MARKCRDPSLYPHKKLCASANFAFITRYPQLPEDFGVTAFHPAKFIRGEDAAPTGFLG